MSVKRLLIVSDLHCGHAAGLTPPGYWRGVFAAEQRRFWRWYEKTIAAIGPVDALLANGDMIDGRGEKSGGTELIAVDRHEQCEMAYQCLSKVDASRRFLTAGTPYHTGKCEQFEQDIAKDLDAEYAPFFYLSANGVTIHARHHVGGSTIPHGAATPGLKELLWHNLQHVRHGTPRVTQVIRSHVHRLSVAATLDGRVISTPGMQLASRYSWRLPPVDPDVGFVLMEISDSGDVINRVKSTVYLYNGLPRPLVEAY